MAKGDAWWTAQRKRGAMESAEAEGRVADSLDVRLALLDRVKAGEITLDEAQAELKRIKRGAKAAGMTTRNRAWREG